MYLEHLDKCIEVNQPNHFRIVARKGSEISKESDPWRRQDVEIGSESWRIALLICGDHLDEDHTGFVEKTLQNVDHPVKIEKSQMWHHSSTVFSISNSLTTWSVNSLFFTSFILKCSRKFRNIIFRLHFKYTLKINVYFKDKLSKCYNCVKWLDIKMSD